MNHDYHTFSGSYAKGKRGEDAVEALLKHAGYSVNATGMMGQKQGKDFLVGGAVTVEVKTDDEAARTGNIFVETTSNDQTGATGWAHYTKADLLVILVGEDGMVTTPDAVREHLRRWTAAYGTRTARNKGFSSEGICVPRAAFLQDTKAHAFGLDDPDDAASLLQEKIAPLLHSRVCQGFPMEAVGRLVLGFRDISKLRWEHLSGNTVNYEGESCTLSDDDILQLRLWCVKGEGMHIHKGWPLVLKMRQVRLWPMPHDQAYDLVDSYYSGRK